MATPPLTLAAARLSLDALHAHGSVRQAATALGVGRSTLHEHVQALRELAARMRAFDEAAAPEEPEAVEPAPVPANDEPAARPEPFRLGGSAVDREVVKLRDEVRRLRASLEDCHRDALARTRSAGC